METEEQLEAVIDKTKQLVTRDLKLDRANFVQSMLNFSTRHHFYVTLMIDEKIKVEKLEHDLHTMKLVAKSQYKAAKGNRVQITKKEEDQLLMESDPRIYACTREISIRKKYIEYLTEVSKIFASQKFVFTAIKDIIKIEST